MFWLMLAAARMREQGLELYAKNLEILPEKAKIQQLQRPAPATSNRTMLDLRTMALRDYSAPEGNGIPTIVHAPYAGHSAVIADYYKGQSLVETLLANGLGRVFLTDWKSAREDMKDPEIDQYLAELGVWGTGQSDLDCARGAGCRRCTPRASPARWSVWCLLERR